MMDWSSFVHGMTWGVLIGVVIGLLVAIFAEARKPR